MSLRDHDDQTVIEKAAFIEHLMTIGNFNGAINLIKELLNSGKVRDAFLFLFDMDLGVANYFEHEYERSLRHYEEALLKIIGSAEYKSIAQCYLGIGLCKFALNRYDSCIDDLKFALHVAGKLDDRAFNCMTHLHISRAYLLLKNNTLALEHIRQASHYSESPEHKLYVLWDEASLAEEISGLHDAIPLYKKALKLALSTKNHILIKQSTTLLGQAMLTQNAKIGIRHLHRASIITDALSKSYFFPSNRISKSTIPFIVTSESAHELLVNYYLETFVEDENDDSVENAFKYMERDKSRWTLDLLASSYLPYVFNEPKPPKDLLAKEERIHREIQKVKLDQLTSFNQEFKNSDLKKLRRKQQVIHKRIKRFDETFVELREGQITTIAKLQRTLGNDYQSTCVVHYYLTKNRLNTVIIMPTRAYVQRISVSTKSLVTLIKNHYVNEVINQPNYPDIGKQWITLTDYFIEPISNILKDVEHICFVPDSALRLIPYHALLLNDSPLAAMKSVSYAQSASILNFCRSRTTNPITTCVVFGYGHTEEAVDIAKIMDGKLIADSDFTKKQFFENLKFDIIHISTNSARIDQKRRLMGLEMHDETLLAKDIYNLSIGSDLVNLSACEIMAPNLGDQYGPLGFVDAFLFAGARSIIASLWAPNPTATKKLMAVFYKNLKDGKSKAKALQLAQHELMKESAFTHEYFWAPFILIGDWSQLGEKNEY